ncbi:hypothetical protein OKW38_004673 [Paraburkholderia sp. MM5496-R1]
MGTLAPAMRWPTASGRERVFPSRYSCRPPPRRGWGVAGKRCLEETTKLAGKVDRDARVDGALLVKEPLGSFESEHPFMPDVWMDVEALLSIKAKAHELLWRYVVPGQRQGNVERAMVERKEQLSTVWVVVRVPKQHALRYIGVVVTGCFRLHCVRKDVVAAHSLVSTVQNVPAPFAHKCAFGRACLITGSGVNGPCTHCRPLHNLDRTLARVCYKPAESIKRCGGRIDHGH